MFSWGFVAVLAAVLAGGSLTIPARSWQSNQQAATGFQLPPVGPVETTASIGQSPAFQQVAILPPPSAASLNGAGKEPLLKEVAFLRNELKSLRKELENLHASDDRLSSDLTQLAAATTQVKDKLENRPEKMVVPEQTFQPTFASDTSDSPIETLPAPETGLLADNPAQPAFSKDNAPWNVAARELANQVVPAGPAPTTVASITGQTTAMPVDLAKHAGTAQSNSSLQIKQTAFALDLGRFESQEEMENAWDALTQAHSAILPPRIQRSSQRERTSFLLIAGPVANASDALKICAQLSLSDAHCRLQVFKP
ncbi:SPOR domain-containing protein [Pseudovibrio flavus]|uniref:SPOR domain-containing protein n=1 Tax=Pseudovibrio flavus TaxID=2529854 RepID=UPI00211BBE2D|nr:SPOR domain-containing protein [Pseudovibrio flavus]